MTSTVKKAFLKRREYQMMTGIDRTVEAEGRKGFIFTTKNGTPIMTNALNNVLYNIVNAYNREELEADQKQRRKEILMPSISAHTLRHTGCTRMEESGLF
ncbi:MAG: site-specific integrase [Lachnospiraceae bacterium]|nr:site-specific integrase [Lachnospiraceae bacterium]